MPLGGHSYIWDTLTIGTLLLCYNQQEMIYDFFSVSFSKNKTKQKDMPPVFLHPRQLDFHFKNLMPLF